MRIFISFLLLLTLISCDEKNSKEPLLVYVGAASKPPTEEIVALFEKETGIDVDVIFGGSGYVLSQMELSGKGDIYFPGSSDYMEIAKRKQLVFPETEAQVVYLVNAINVQTGNPKNIHSLRDLCLPGLRVAIANPEGVCVGSYAVEIIEQNLTEEEKVQLRKNLINFTESCDKTAAAISLKTVDAVIGWRVFAYWNPELIETVDLNPDEIIRIGYIPIAISTLTKNKADAQRFIDFVLSEKGKSTFAKYHYFQTPENAQEYIGQPKPVGGEYAVPESWLTN